jgi:hypothetical protein
MYLSEPDEMLSFSFFESKFSYAYKSNSNENLEVANNKLFQGKTFGLDEGIDIV